MSDYLYGPWNNRGFTPNPFFNIANQFMPRNFKEVLRWADYIVTQSPTSAEVIRKHATYPITDFLYDTDNEKIRSKYEKIEKSVKLKHSLNDIGFSFYTRGNVFISVYLPFNRMAICPTCKTMYNVANSGNVKFQNFKFTGACAKDNCGYTGIMKVVDIPSKNVDDINIVSWDPNYMVVNHNPITGQSEFYYQIPPMVRKKVMLGDPLFTSTLPLAMLEAIQHKKQFKFDRKSIFHLANVSIGKMEDGLCIPPIMAIYSLVFHQAMMRRANEAIASEHMTPMRAVFPQPTSANGDPVISMSLGGFVNNMETNIKKFKHDPNHMIISPVPIGYQAIGGDGKNLLVAQEIQLAEESILMSLGVSRELMSGTTNWTSSTVGLRLLRNTMDNYVRQIQELIDWLFDRITAFLNIERVEVSMTPFQLTDDDLLKQLLPSLLQQNMVSKTTALAAVGLDYHEELEKKVKEAQSEAKFKIQAEQDIDRAKFNASRETQTSDREDAGFAESKAKAYDTFLQIMSMDPASQQAILLQMEQQDKTMYELVMGLMEKFQAPADPAAEQEQGGQEVQPAESNPEAQQSETN